MTTCTCNPCHPDVCETIHSKKGGVTFNIHCCPCSCEPEPPVDPVPCPYILNADLDLFVSPDGSDDNNGLTPENAFASVFAAVESTRNYARTGHLITINIAPGRYEEHVGVNFYRHFSNLCLKGVGASMPVLVGNVSAMYQGALLCSNVHIQSSYICFAAYRLAFATIRDCALTTVGTDLSMACAASYGAAMNISGSMSVDCSSGMYRILFATENSVIRLEDGQLMCKGTVKEAAVYVMNGGLVTINSSNPLVGTVTGKRYLCTAGGIIRVPGALETYIPGTIAGTVSSGGIYV